MEKIKMFGELEVHISTTRKEMGVAAGKRIEQIIKSAIKENGEARVIFASAPSQNEMLAYLKDTDIDWSKVTGFHMDEYVGIDKTAPQSFTKFLEDRLVNHVSMGHWYPFGGTTPSVEEDLKLYTKLLNEQPIDLVILGIGENGHLAFNDPAFCDFNDPLTVKTVDLDEVCRKQQVNDGCFTHLDLVPKQALTITIPPLLACKKKVAVVPGPTKKHAILNTLLGEITPNCPASILRTCKDSELYIDEDSYSLVKE
ncbi:MAG: glucosamine-6-phosphate deaminase [Anaeroplasmataceae bacterium]|nr:glucosamine-6-phosphate deaminase [Anaeroplasmataceae bacterium]